MLPEAPGGGTASVSSEAGFVGPLPTHMQFNPSFMDLVSGKNTHVCQADIL